MYASSLGWEIHVAFPVWSCFFLYLFWRCALYLSYSTEPDPLAENAFYSDDMRYTSKAYNLGSFDSTLWDIGILISCTFCFNTQHIQKYRKVCMHQHKIQWNTVQYPHTKHFITLFYCICLCLCISSRQFWITAVSEGSLLVHKV